MTESKKDLSPETPAEIAPPPAEKKPVILYILILVFATLLLMALSLLMSQRNEDRTLDELQISVNEIHQMQGTREELYELQQRVKELEEAQSRLEAQLESEEASRLTLEQERRALECLLALQEAWEKRDVEFCRIIMQEMANEGLIAHLPDQAREGLTPAAAQYNELKESVLNWQSRAQEPDEPPQDSN